MKEEIEDFEENDENDENENISDIESNQEMEMDDLNEITQITELLEDREDKEEKEDIEITEMKEESEEESESDEEIEDDELLKSEMNERIFRYQKKENERIERQRKIGNCKVISERYHMSRNDFSTIVFPTIMNILLTSKVTSKADKHRLKQSLSHFHINSRTWKCVVQNGMYKHRLEKCSQTKKKFIVSFFDNIDE